MTGSRLTILNKNLQQSRISPRLYFKREKENVSQFDGWSMFFFSFVVEI